MTYKRVVLAEDLTDASTWETVDTEDVIEFLTSRFDVFPATAKIYHGDANAHYEVTPNNQEMIDRLQTLPGPFYVIVYPEYDGGYLEIAAIVAIIALVAVVATMPKPVTGVNVNQQQPSPNNELAARQNTARPYQRIEDIYGTVRSTPTLLMLPYSEYINNKEYEHAYMCIGRGEFDILDARDDTTPINSIDGAGVTVYGPGDSPNWVLPAIIPPRTVFGLSNAVPVQTVARCTAVNGQDLLTDSESAQIGTYLSMQWSMSLATGRGTIVFTAGEDLSSFSAGDSVYLFAKGYKTHHTTHDIFISGTYIIYSVDSTTLVLKDVQSVAHDWGWIAWPGEFGFTESYVVAPLALSVGPFFLPQPDQYQIWMNLIATNGMYQLDGSGNASAVNCTIKAVIQPTDISGNPVGEPYTNDLLFNGDPTKITVAVTWKLAVYPIGPCTVTMYRSTSSPVSAQVSDAVKWKDLYSVTPVAQTNFGNVTTVYSVTKATAGALAVKQRKLNLLVQRRVPARITGTTFGSPVGSNNVADILCAAALDPYIGMRTVNEIDVDNIYSTSAAIALYFGTTQAREFCYTFDTNNLSFEDIVHTIATAVFCVAYRQGSTLRLAFEQKTENSLMLFGHRNKLPKSEKRSVTFGPTNNYDSVEFSYVSPVDDSKVTLYIPEQSVNPNKIEGTGIRNYAQAYYQAWRAWNKLVYQNVATEFDATEEAALLKINDRVLVADNTRSGTQDGEVVSQNVLELELTQPVVFAIGKSYAIFLQGIDESVESIPISVGSSSYHVLLARVPSVTLSLDEDSSVRSLYWIVANDDVRPQAFLVTKRETGSQDKTHKITAVNYDDRYYSRDADTPTGGT